MIKLLRDHLSVGNPTVIFICFIVVTLIILFPFVCYAELTKKKIKKQKKKRSNKRKNNREYSDNRAINKPSKMKTASKTLIPSIDTEFSDEDEVLNEKSAPSTQSTKYIQGLTYDIDEDDLGEWKVVSEKKSKRTYTERAVAGAINQEKEKRISKPKNKQVKSRNPVNRVPGMTD